MRRYQKFGAVIIAQLLCTTLLAQSIMAFDIQLEKNQQSYSAETNEKLSSDFQEEITSMDLITPPIQIIDSISQCKNFPKRHLFPI